ncbi:MAG TPA: hypothetical protein VNM87_11015 [Candidatus Udaeobacter sp.]|nr:hypothetical protein [Candidatus Udaeobacter sp.]
MKSVPSRLTSRAALLLAVVSLGVVLAAGCGDDDENPTPTGEFAITLTGFEALPAGHYYEAWARFPLPIPPGLRTMHGDEDPVSLGAFQINSAGDIESLEGGPVTFQLAEPRDLGQVIDVVISIRETKPDTTIGSVLVGGVVLGNDNEAHVTMTTDYHHALGTDIRSATGSCVLATPSNGDNTNENQGIWFSTPTGGPALIVPPLEEGWHYDAYLLLGAKEIELGSFARGDTADSDGAGAEGDLQPGFNTPGSDFLISAHDLAAGGVSVLIALQPGEDVHEGFRAHGSVFPYHVLEADIPAGTLPRTPIALQVATEPLPAGTVTFTR